MAGNLSETKTSQFRIDIIPTNPSNPSTPLGTDDEDEDDAPTPVLFAQNAIPPTFPGPTTGNDDDTSATDTDSDVLGDSAQDTSKEGSVLASEDSKDHWSLANLLLTVVIWATTLMALVGLFGKDKEERKAAVRAATLVPAVGAAVILYFVEDFSAVMSWVNIWTIPLIVLAIVQVILLTKARSQAE
jgi:hypothetical protein